MYLLLLTIPDVSLGSLTCVVAPQCLVLEVLVGLALC